MSGIAIPEYRPEYFVDRERALNLVLDKVRALLRGESIRNRTTIFLGPRGSGKSWLLREIYRRLREEQEFADRVISIFVALGEARAGVPENGIAIPADESSRAWPILRVSRLLEAVGEHLAIGSPLPVELDRLGSIIIQILRSRNRTVVVLVDGIDETPPAFLRELETHFLAPLALEPYVLIVLGGRIRDPHLYAWITPELAFYADDVWLEPFDEPDAEEQLRQLSISPKTASEVLRVGNGYPLSNIVLARYLQGDPPQWSDRPAALRECAEVLLENVDDSLREYFWALCVLRGFDELRMAPLLAVWFGSPLESWTYLRCRRIREGMAATRLVRWMEPERFVMDEAVRAVLENALREGQPERWRALHRAAYEMYNDWAQRYQRYPTAKERWEPEARYHSQFLQGDYVGGEKNF